MYVTTEYIGLTVTVSLQHMTHFSSFVLAARTKFICRNDEWYTAEVASIPSNALSPCVFQIVS